MTPLQIVLLIFLLVVATLASYIQRIYSEFGKILSRDVQENLDAWETTHRTSSRPQPRPRCSLRLCSEADSPLALSLSSSVRCFSSGPLTSARPTRPKSPSPSSPSFWSSFSLPAHSRSRSLTALAACGYRGFSGLSAFCSGLSRRSPSSSVSSFPLRRWPRLPPAPKRKPLVDVEALIEAGEEEGILEQSDSDLVRSAVEFGDMLVREVMTPRPEIFAVPESTTLERLSRTSAPAQLLARPRLFRLARQHHRPRLRSRPAADYRRGGPHPHRRQHPAPSRFRPRNQARLRAAARDAARKAAHAHRHR